MNPRERITAWERERLSLYAVLSERSQGRGAADEPDDTRTCFQRDTDRIVHSKAFRRLMHKTQMFLMPEGDHYRTRMTHAIEVSRIARTMARALRLNEDLTEAVALGHDLGHAPFGHAGERALNGIVSGGFSHNAQSLRIVRRLEKNGRGLNLSLEVEEGILRHSGDEPAATLEGRLVHYADRIAYLSHDMDDAIRGGLLTLESVPSHLRQVLGDTPRERINTLVTDLIAHSQNQGELCLSPEKQQAMDELRAFMFSEVYTHPVAKAEESKLCALMELLFSYYCQRYELLPEDLRQIGESDGKERAVCDYISGMTDRFFQQKCVEAFIPQGWSKV